MKVACGSRAIRVEASRQCAEEGVEKWTGRSGEPCYKFRRLKLMRPHCLVPALSDQSFHD